MDISTKKAEKMSDKTKAEKKSAKKSKSDDNSTRKKIVVAAAKGGSIKATSKPKKEPSKLSKKIGGFMMGTGSSNAKTLKANRAAIDAELKKKK